MLAWLIKSKVLNLAAVVASFGVVFLVVLLLPKNNVVVEVLLGLFVGIIVWMITHTYLTWIQSNTVQEHFALLHEILNILRGKTLTLVQKRRVDLSNEFYDDFFKGATEVNVSGIANMRIASELVERGIDHPIIRQLLGDQQTTVKILLTNPESDFARARQEIEEVLGTGRTCISGIQDSIEKLKSLKCFVNGLGKHGIKDGSRLVVKMSSDPMCYAITNAEEEGESKRMMLGMVFQHTLGHNAPIFQLPDNLRTNTALYNHCKSHFNAMFDNPNCKQLLVWDSNGIVIIP